MKSFEDYFFLEEKLDAEDREKIKEDDWGIIIKDKDGNIIEKAYPMPDAQHVISAARMYPFAKRKYDTKVVAELRRKIIAKAKEYNVPDSRIQSVIDDKPGGKSKPVKESVGPEDDTSGTSEFDESVDNDPDDCYTEAYDAITGEEIPIDHAYTMDEMREITLSFTESERPKFPDEFNRISNDIISPIGKYVKEKSQPPTGNQNCQLCVWSMEARFRDIPDALPRPVYSPRDPVLNIPGEAIVYDPKKIHVKSYTDVASEVTKAGDGCRFYVHVNWKDSQGGHEFVLLRIDGKNYMADPQCSMLAEMTKHLKYFTDINYTNSYICRLDDKKFNKPLFDKWNDESTVLPWDPKKDIPYMLKEGMITKEEADKEFRKSSTERFTSELKRELKNHPVQESTLPKGITLRPAEEKDIPNIIQWKLESINQELVDNPKVIKFIKNDARENLNNTRMILCDDDTIGVLESCYIDDGEWWYIGEIYLIPEYRGKGIAKALLQDEIDSHDKLKLKVSKDNDHAIELYKSLGFTVSESDEYSYVMTLVKDSVQEGVIQNIKNKTSPFEKNLVYHISPEGHLDGQVFKPRVPEYLDKYDPSKTEFEDVETPRVCFSPSIEGCLNAIIVNIGRWKTANKLRDWYVYIPEKPLKEYKYRTNKQLVDEKKVYDANITKEIWIEEPVRLKQYGIIRIDSVTDKSRKKAVPTTLGEAKKRNVYDFKWHWLVKPKVLKDVPYDYSPLEVCKDMVADLERYKYGIPENGKIVHGSEHDYNTKWKLQSPEEFEKNGGGICYDYVEFEEGYLDAYGIKCKKYYMSTDLPGEDTHTFILVDDGHGGFVYPESSAGAIAGVHQVKNLDHACNIVADGFWKINDNLNKVKPEKDPNITKPLKKFKCYLWEYTGHPPYGSNMKQCTEYYSKGEPIKEWYQVEPNLGEPIPDEPKTNKAKALQEFVTAYRNDHYMDYDGLDESLFDEYVLSEQSLAEMYVESVIMEAETKPSLLKRIWEKLLQVLKWIKNLIGKVINKIKKFIGRLFHKKNNINDIAAEVLGSNVTTEAYIDSSQMNGRKQKRSSQDYLDRHDMTGGKLAEGINITVKSADTIHIVIDKEYNTLAKQKYANTKSNKHSSKYNRSALENKGAVSNPYYWCYKLKHIDMFEKMVEDIRMLSRNMIDKTGPYEQQLLKIFDEVANFNPGEIPDEYSFDLSIKDLTRYQSCINELTATISMMADNPNLITDPTLGEKMSSLRSVFISEQMTMNYFIKSLVISSDTIAPQYQHKIKSFDKLADFVSTCIKRGVLPKIIMYNTWLVTANELNTQKNYEPVAGQSRMVLFPKDKSVVYKIAYNGFGVSSNKNENNITKLVRGTDIEKYFALIEKMDSAGSVVMQQRVYNDSEEYEQLADEIYARQGFNDDTEFIQNRLVAIQLQKGFKGTVKVIDLHPGNVFYDTHQMTIKFIDYGMLETINGAQIKTKDLSNKTMYTYRDEVVVNAILSRIDTFKGVLNVYDNIEDFKYDIATIDALDRTNDTRHAKASIDRLKKLLDYQKDKTNHRLLVKLIDYAEKKIAEEAAAHNRAVDQLNDLRNRPSRFDTDRYNAAMDKMARHPSQVSSNTLRKVDDRMYEDHLIYKLANSEI